MQVKKYQARTIKEATAKVKDVLGHDAMIISTKKIKGNGKDGLFEIAAIPPKDDISSEHSDLFGEVKSELMSIKEMLYLVNHYGGFSEKLLLTPGILNLYARMIKNGVNDYYARLFLERSGAFNGHSDDDRNNIKGQVFNEIMQVIKTKDPFDIGDHCRLIAAMEQLKTYADILGIPCFRAFKKKDLLFALKRMEGKNVVLIDTAGQSHYDMSRIEELKRMMPGDMNISTHLLLNVATRGCEMNKAAVNFSALNYLSYIFTKTDETERCGSIINQVMKLNLPISYITNGQKVPEDIEQADKEKILKLLLSKN
jgi:flagellar biosynthesis protein FlhF